MFELNDSIIDGIIFAMEDQDSSQLVDIETGEIVSCGEEAEEAGEDLDLESCCPPPEWSSREGFRLMEDFLKTVRSPAARRELSTALNRGRGVFKAFKETLAAFPEAERAFHDFKLKAMRGVIRDWYDDLRESRGLSRLGEEPEETEDLLADDLGIVLGPGERAPGRLLSLAEGAQAEATGLIPAAVVARETALVQACLSEDDWLGAWVEDGEGGVIAAAAASRDHVEGRPIGMVFFVYVLPEFRRCGLGRALLSKLSQAFRAEGTELLALDSAFLPPEFGLALESSGFTSYGCRGYFQA